MDGGENAGGEIDVPLTCDWRSNAPQYISTPSYPYMCYSKVV